MRSAARALVGALLLSSVGTTGVLAQSSSDILNRMMKSYEQRIAGVDNYTLVQDAVGVETTQYFVKEMVNGRPVFRLSKSIVGGMMIDQETPEESWDTFYARADEIAQHVRYEGRDNVNGHSVHVLVVDDPESIDFDGMMNASPEEQDEEDFRAEKMTMFVDRDLLVMRRMVVDGQMTHEGETHPVTSTVDLDDYRDINGMLYPFRTSVTMEGMAEAMGMTDDDMAEMREQLEEAKRQMDQMPEAQRAMMEKMLKQQMEQMEKMMQDQGGGGMQVEVLVKDLRVNSGPPSN
ncbi:MAG: DUF5339 domain-containing protein [Gemmatimonadota bacterium]|nr:DUF5339 domain-containing protein [Gemmatimonadota bacterium]